jgi:hypothetical protein
VQVRLNREGSISYGGKKNARDMAGMAVSSKKGYSPEVNMLLANGAGPNLKDNENATRLLVGFMPKQGTYSKTAFRAR